MKLTDIIKMVEMFGSSLNVAIEEHLQELEEYLQRHIDDFYSLMGISHLMNGSLVFIYRDSKGKTKIYELGHYDLVTYKLAAGQKLTKHDIEFAYYAMPSVDKEEDTIYIAVGDKYFAVSNDYDQPVEVRRVSVWRAMDGK